jgi:hypothetical protein
MCCIYAEDFVLTIFGQSTPLDQFIILLHSDYHFSDKISYIYQNCYVRYFLLMDLEERKKPISYSAFCFRFWRINYMSIGTLLSWLRTEIRDLHSFYFLLCYTQLHNVVIKEFPFQIFFCDVFVFEDLLENALFRRKTVLLVLYNANPKFNALLKKYRENNSHSTLLKFFAFKERYWIRKLRMLKINLIISDVSELLGLNNSYCKDLNDAFASQDSHLLFSFLQQNNYNPNLIQRIKEILFFLPIFNY